MKDKCSNCKKEISLQKVVNNYYLCYLCNYDLSKMKELEGIKTQDELKSKKTKTKKLDISDSDQKLQSDNNHKYPALEFIISSYTVISVIAFIGSFIFFGFSLKDIGFIQASLFTIGLWFIIISVYSYAELIRIFIRIEENTRK